ncbi:MAG: hypothetical protein ACFFAN_15765 [Promethearchaeota archaeon]
MENVEDLEMIANENITIAKNEKVIYNDSKMVFKQALKRAEARENLVKSEIELAKLKERLSEKSKKMIERKEKIKDILNFSGNHLRIETDYAIYNENIAEAQKEIAKVQKNIAIMEKQIAEEELKILNEKFDVSKERELLGKKQLNYVRLMKISAPNGKLTKAEEEYLNQQKKLNEAIKDVYKKSVEIMKTEDKLADLKKELSFKLVEREKIRPPSP